jgi:transcriptional regulator with XRE-family HTH domain
LSGVSVTWYTWLEQGREIRPSRQVLDALARTLRLTTAEHGYLLSLAGYVPAPPIETPAVADAPPNVQRLMDGLQEFPAYAIVADWGIAGWNAAYEAFYPNVARVERRDRNLLWLVFTDPYVRDLLPDWAETSRRFLVEFRAEVGPRLGDERLLQLIDRLSEASPEFRSGWAAHDVGGFTSRERIFDHPIVGRLRLEHHQVIPADHPDLQIVIYTPVPGTGSMDQLRRLTAPT